MARMDWTRIFVAAPGLRPTASEAFMPIKPTANGRAKRRQTNVQASQSYQYLPFLSARRLPRSNTVEPPKIRHSIVRARGSFSLMLTNQQSEDRGQQHEDQRLNQTHQQFQEVERNRQQPAEAGNQRGHGFQHVFPGKDVAVETKTQRDRPEQNRDRFPDSRPQRTRRPSAPSSTRCSRPWAQTAP